MIQLRSLATLSHRRSLALVGRAGLGPNTNSNEVLGVEDKFRVGGELELIFFVDIYFSFLGGFTWRWFISQFSWGPLSWGLHKRCFFFFVSFFPCFPYSVLAHTWPAGGFSTNLSDLLRRRWKWTYLGSKLRSASSARHAAMCEQPRIDFTMSMHLSWKVNFFMRYWNTSKCFPTHHYPAVAEFFQITDQWLAVFLASQQVPGRCALYTSNVSICGVPQVPIHNLRCSACMELTWMRYLGPLVSELARGRRRRKRRRRRRRRRRIRRRRWRWWWWWRRWWPWRWRQRQNPGISSKTGKCVL